MISPRRLLAWLVIGFVMWLLLGFVIVSWASR
jgi:hypothetical protein